MEKKNFKVCIGSVAIVTMLLFLGFAAKNAFQNLFGKGAGTFMAQLILHPTEVGTIAPCSKYAAYEITKPIRELRKKSDGYLRILEVGAGSGAFTDQIIKDACDNYKLDAVEINVELSELLKERFKNNHNVHIHQADIIEWEPTDHYDVIISALPFNIFSKEMLQKIFEKYLLVAVPGTYLSYFELRGTTRLRKLFLSEYQTQLLDDKLKYIRAFRKKYLVETVPVSMNVPPIYVYHLRF